MGGRAGCKVSAQASVLAATPRPARRSLPSGNMLFKDGYWAVALDACSAALQTQLKGEWAAALYSNRSAGPVRWPVCQRGHQAVELERAV